MNNKIMTHHLDVNTFQLSLKQGNNVGWIE
jgi:hypothetical protein